MEIEIVFYLIAAILSPFLLRSNYAGQLLLGCAIINTVKGSAYVAYSKIVWVIPLAPFKALKIIKQSAGIMFIGTLFHLASGNKITPSQLILGVIACVWGFSVGVAAHPGLKFFY